MVAAVTLDADGRMAVPGFVEPPGPEALRRRVRKGGVDVVGGMPFKEASPQDSRRHIEIVFEIAREFDADIDMHVDETDDPAARTLEVLAELTIQRGWQGRVTAGHTCALASYPRNYADHVIGRRRQATVNVIATPATNLMLQGRLDDYPKRRGVTQVKELLAAGVNVACGQDCVHDTFYPFGQNDPLEIAFLLCHASQMSQPAEILTVMDMVTNNGAKALRIPDFGVAVGAVADLVGLDARDAREGFATTDRGRTFLYESEQVMGDLLSLTDTARRLRGALSDTLTIGMGSGMAQIFIPRMFADLERDLPGVRLEIMTAPTKNIFNELHEERIDAGIAIESNPDRLPAGLVFYRLVYAQLALIPHPKHAMAPS